jgi:hypothetical protein
MHTLIEENVQLFERSNVACGCPYLHMQMLPISSRIQIDARQLPKYTVKIGATIP